MNTTIQRPTTPRLGVDIGRVIIHGDGPDTSFIGGADEDAMRAPAMEGAFEALARLTDRFGGRVFVVSKCGPRIEARSRAWLERHRFFESTGIARESLRFCRKRPDKAPICRELGIDFFVDDRLDVLAAMAGVVRHRFLFGAASSPEPGVTPAPTWAAAERAIVAALDEISLRGTPAARAP
ncbi:MAG: hypothetical protein KF819_38240 [Labilithrix sp.]|nr:hypothetical protein [Labilithrix sp.]